jgi:hypothetical protein
VSRTGNQHSPGNAGPKLAVRGLLLRLFMCIAVLAVLGGTVQWLARSYRSDQKPGAATGQAAYVDLQWETLIPKEWDPTKRFRNKALGESNDSSPGAMDLERQMRETWDNAPTNRAMNGARVRLVGYVVPLEASKGALREFLLVPYFGACIHVPPPPANQIVHVSLAVPAKGLRTMDSVWVTGTLSIARNKSVMGMSGYSMEAVRVEPRAMKVW